MDRQGTGVPLYAYASQPDTYMARHSEESRCPVCLDDMSTSSAIVCCSGGHQICEACVSYWVQTCVKQGVACITCPTCREAMGDKVCGLALHNTRTGTFTPDIADDMVQSFHVLFETGRFYTLFAILSQLGRGWIKYGAVQCVVRGSVCGMAALIDMGLEDEMLMAELLTQSVSLGFLSLVQLALTSPHCNPNRAWDGCNPLHVAVEVPGREHILRYLLDTGVDVSIKTEHTQKTAIEIATAHQGLSYIQMLLQHVCHLEAEESEIE